MKPGSIQSIFDKASPLPKVARADELLVRQHLVPSRSAGQHLIRNGRVLAGGVPVRKPGQFLPENTVLSIVEDTEIYVSRGAEKLLAAIHAFSPAIEGKVALDLGASTGGFTEVLLKYGASRVYAVDVGTAQLHPKLKADSRVISLENTNARDLDANAIPEKIQILTGDLSFISLTKVLPACAPLLADDFLAMLLVKPQFEAERKDIGSGGVVRSEEVRLKCVSKIVDFAEQELAWQHLGTVPSPILGQNGNQEYMLAFSRRSE